MDFDPIAKTYDKMNRLMTLGIDRLWRRRAVKQVVNNHRCQLFLDEAVGTGDMAADIMRLAHPQSRLTGIDISAKMMSVAEQKLDLSRCTLLQADAEQLPFDDGSFDVVTIAFGIRNYQHREVALREIYRVLKPQGRLLILELSYPDNPFLLWCYKIYACRIIPWLGGLVSGSREAYEYLPASILRFPKPDQFVPILAQAGFDHIEHRAYTFGVCRQYIASKS